MQFITSNWQWGQWALYAVGGLGLFGWYSRSIKLLLAAVAVVALVVMAGVIYQKGVNAEHARVLAETERLNAAAIAVYQALQLEDDVKLKSLQKLVDDTPPSSDRVALSGERAKRVGAVR